MTICSPQIGIDPNSNLGGGVSDRETLKALAQLGVRIIIALPEGEPHETVENWEIVPTGRHKWKYYEYNIIFRRAVRRMVRQGRTFDLMRAHSAHSTGPGLLGLARRLGIPSHLDYHHWEKHLLRNLLERWTLGRYDLVTTPSEFSRRVLIERYGLTNRVVAVHQGVRTVGSPVPAAAELRARYTGRQVLLHVGVHVPRKNLSFLLRVLKRLGEKGRDNVVLILAGTGPQEAQLRQEASDLGVRRRVEFPGRISEPEKAEYYRLCDVFVFPSLLEGFGMAAGEAMAFGKPVVAANRTAIPEVVLDGETGFLADPTEVGDFAEKIDGLLESPELRERFGRAGRRRITGEFSFQRKAEQVLHLYRMLKGGTESQ